MRVHRGANRASSTLYCPDATPPLHMAAGDNEMTENAMAEDARTGAIVGIAGVDAAALQPVEAGYRRALAIRNAILLLPLAAVASFVDAVILRANDLPWGGLIVGSLLLAAIGIFTLPNRAWHKIGYAFGDDALRVAHGMWFRRDTIVPFVRVQHIDVGQGPVERMCGVAHLVLHTAGTHNSIVTLPGLLPERAAQMRDAIRALIRSDFA